MSTDTTTHQIPLPLAVGAFRGTSFSPEERGERFIASFHSTQASAAEQIREAGKETPEAAETAVERWQAGHHRRAMRLLQSRQGLVSTMIAGPARFPAARMNRKSDVVHARMVDLLSWESEILRRVIADLRPRIPGQDGTPIRADDDDAVPALERRIRELEERQELMKETNATIRKHWKAGIETVHAALVLLGHEPAKAAKLLRKDNFGGLGYPAFDLTNNSANIRRLKQRLEHVSRSKAEPTTTQEGTTARIEDCPPENRIRLFFLGKPEAELRTELKKNGFRWTPSLGCWQAYRNSWSLKAASEIANRPAVAVA